MESLRLGVAQEHAGVLIEFDHDHRALNAVVVNVVIAIAADPGKMRLTDMPLDFA
jgi:hypothetical protein